MLLRKSFLLFYLREKQPSPHFSGEKNTDKERLTSPKSYGWSDGPSKMYVHLGLNPHLSATPLCWGGLQRVSNLVSGGDKEGFEEGS